MEKRDITEDIIVCVTGGYVSKQHFREIIGATSRSTFLKVLTEVIDSNERLSKYEIFLKSTRHNLPEQMVLDILSVMYPDFQIKIRMVN